MVFLPSIASADPLALREGLESLGDWPFLHIDIEDGNFVPNITFGMKAVRAICEEIQGKEMQVHLMTKHPENYLGELALCGVSSVIAHVEALDYPMDFLNHCKCLGMKAGLALNMKTPVSSVDMFFGCMDELLLMTAEPDGMEQALYPVALKRAVEMAQEKGRDFKVYVDGGITAVHMAQLWKAGTDGVILGRAVFKKQNPLKFLRQLEEIYT